MAQHNVYYQFLKTTKWKDHARLCIQFVSKVFQT